jgi:hypothetical protein
MHVERIKEARRKAEAEAKRERREARRREKHLPSTTSGK